MPKDWNKTIQELTVGKYFFGKLIACLCMSLTNSNQWEKLLKDLNKTIQEFGK
jgi:hypothetical protein